MLQAGVWFVAPDGSDNSGTGTIVSPFFTITFALSHAQPSDTIYMRGGSYFYTTAMELSKSGALDARIHIFAYNNEQPIIDGSQMSYTTATERKSRRGIHLLSSANYYFIKGIEIINAPDNGMRIRSSFNRIEKCVFHHNRNTGLQIGLEESSSNDGSNVRDNYVLNCDSYRNCDSAKLGGDADGFACKLNAGVGNIFENCRSWENSDDGWDLFYHHYAVELRNCWTWHNGDASLFPEIENFSSNGNGFKLGGRSKTYNIYSHGIHKVTNCISFNNSFSTGRGFDQNAHRSGNIIYNCLSFGNKMNYYFPENPDDGTSNTIKNNVSFNAISTGVSIHSSAVVTNNSWNISSIAADANDYFSLAESLAASPRQPDGRLPSNTFARLSAQSDLIDKGTDVGIPFIGTAPDLGPFEYDSNTGISTGKESMVQHYILFQNYPNPFNPTTTITYFVETNNYTSLRVFDVLGREVATLVNEVKPAGAYTVQFNASKLSSGMYVYQLRAGNYVSTKKLVLMK